MAKDDALFGAIRAFIVERGAAGTTPEALEKQFPDVSRSTINRRLAALVESGAILAVGAGRTTKYMTSSPFSVENIRQYLSVPWQERPIARFREELLQPEPNLSMAQCERLARLTGRAAPLDRKFLANFLIDLSWGSSVLEGSTYTDIDTQVLIEYGQRNKDKSMEDSVMILNHKNAIEHLWMHRDLSVESVREIHSRLTDRHGLPEVEESEHFLPGEQQGVPRRYEDVNLGRSAYLPPFRPESDFIGEKFREIVHRANTLHPVQSAFYLMTRIPYLQVFANGNKRTSRLAANSPLLQNNFMPISFVDFDRANYIQGMAAFYEMGATALFEKVFVEGYVRSIVRSSDIPPNLRALGFSIEATVQDLLRYVQSGRNPDGVSASFIGAKPDVLDQAARTRPRQNPAKRVE